MEKNLLKHKESAVEFEHLILKVQSVKRMKPLFNQLNADHVRSLIHNARTGGSTRGGSRHFSFDQYMQSSIVKVSYATNRHAGQWKAHGRYLEREGAQVEGERGKGFDEKNNDINISGTLSEWQKHDPYFFKFIISPQEASRLDMKQHVRTVMKKVESDLGTKLSWIGIDHCNSDNIHAHVVLRARDEQGKVIVLDRSYIKQGIRQRSQEAATQKLGVPLAEDILRSRKEAISKKHITIIDRDILKLKDESNRISFKGVLPESRYQKEKQLQIMARLQFLVEVGFAKKVGTHTWEVFPQLEAGLKAYQISQDIMKRSARSMAHASEELPLKYTQLKEGERIAGRIIGMGLHSEVNDKRYLLIEGIDGHIHYTHPTKEILRLRDEREIKNGHIIFLEVKSYYKNKEKKLYLDFDHYRSLEELKQARTQRPIDHYAASVMLKNNIAVDGTEGMTFRKDFFAMMERRSAVMFNQDIKLKYPVIKQST